MAQLVAIGKVIRWLNQGSVRLKSSSSNPFTPCGEDNSENENETAVNLDPPTKIETQLVVAQLKNGEAAGLGNMYPEVLKKLTLK